MIAKWKEGDKEEGMSIDKPTFPLEVIETLRKAGLMTEEIEAIRRRLPRKEELPSGKDEALVNRAWLEIYFHFREGANVWITGYEKKIKRTLRKLLQEAKQ